MPRDYGKLKAKQIEHLMEDAWRCLGFPDVPETSLGNMVAKLPRSAQIFRRRPRQVRA